MAHSDLELCLLLVSHGFIMLISYVKENVGKKRSIITRRERGRAEMYEQTFKNTIQHHI
jgi:hypothetical protein